MYENKITSIFPSTTLFFFFSRFCFFPRRDNHRRKTRIVVPSDIFPIEGYPLVQRISNAAYRYIPRAFVSSRSRARMAKVEENSLRNERRNAVVTVPRSVFSRSTVRTGVSPRTGHVLCSMTFRIVRVVKIPDRCTDGTPGLAFSIRTLARTQVF